MLRIALPAFLILLASTAMASPRPLPYTYPSEMLQEGQFEVEQYVDLTPAPGIPPNGGTPTTFLRSVLTTELEYGLRDTLELGLYFQFSDDPGSLLGETAEAPLYFDGIAQRLRWGLARPGEWPIDVVLYGEISEFQNELEVEAKVNLQRRFGHLRLMVNLWAEREFYYTGRQEWVLHPTGGTSYEIRPWITVGAEWWMTEELGPSVPGVATTFNQEAHQYLGPTVMFQFQRLWWSIGPYARLDNTGRVAQPGDQYGAFWLRTVIGVDLN